MRRNRLSPEVLLAFKSHRSDKYPAETREDTRKTVSQNPGKGSISKEKGGAQLWLLTVATEELESTFGVVYENALFNLRDALTTIWRVQGRIERIPEIAGRHLDSPLRNFVLKGKKMVDSTGEGLRDSWTWGDSTVF